MGRGWKKWTTEILVTGVSLGLISLVWAAMSASPATAATTCGLSSGTATIQLDQPAATPTTVSMDGSHNLTVNGTACGTGFPTEIELAVTNGAPAQTVVLDQTGAGGVFPCPATVAGTLRSSDTLVVQGAAAENITVGDVSSGTGVNLNSCGSVGTITGLGSYRLDAGPGSETLSAGGGAQFTGALTIPATLQASTASETFVGGLAEDSIDFSALSTALTVDVSGETVASTANDTATSNGNTYTFTSFGTTPLTFIGASADTSYLAGSVKDTFNGAGGVHATTLDFSEATGSALKVCVAAGSGCSAGEAQLGASTESFSDITGFVGLPGGNTDFVIGSSGGQGFTGQGADNILDASAAPTGTQVDAGSGDVSGLAGGTQDGSSDIGEFVGATAGGTTFVAGGNNAIFVDPGSAAGDSIDFSKLLTSQEAPLTLNVSGAPDGEVGNDTAVDGAVTYTFSNGGAGFTDFTGPIPGWTTFLAGANGGYTFTGQGTDNLLDATAAPAGLTVDAKTDSLAGLSSAGTDAFSGFADFTGSAAGHTTFVGGSDTETFNGLGNQNTYTAGTGNETFNGTGSNDSIDFSALSTPLTVNVSGRPLSSTPNDTATTNGYTYTFTSYGSTPLSFTGAAASTNFLAGQAADTFNGTSGQPTTLNLEALPGSGVTVCLAAEQGCTVGHVEFGAVTIAMTNISDFVGSDDGDTTFVASGTGGYSFGGLGSSGNALDLTAAARPTVSRPNGVVTNLAPGLGDSTTDTFSGIGTFDVPLWFSSTPPADAVVGDTYIPTAVGTGSTNPVILSVDPATTNSACSLSNDGTLTFDHAGQCVVAANQVGEGPYADAQPATQQIVVGPAATTTAVTVAPTSITATVNSTGSSTTVPAGMVTFTVDGSTVGHASLNDSDVASLAYVVRSGQSRVVAATYAGDSDFTGSSGSMNRRDPTITAHLSSAHGPTHYGWYRSAVTVRFTCKATSAHLISACPAPVKLSHQGAGQAVHRTISAADGGTATVVVRRINIDTTPPTVVVKGVKSGRTYRHAPHLKIHAVDRLSGVASSHISHSEHRKSGLITVHYRATAVDRAGNVSVVTGLYRIRS